MEGRVQGDQGVEGGQREEGGGIVGCESVPTLHDCPPQGHSVVWRVALDQESQVSQTLSLGVVRVGHATLNGTSWAVRELLDQVKDHE